jgi:hypothetical protein
MTKQEFSTLAATLKASYSNSKFFTTREQVDVWYEMLCDLPYPDANRSVQKYIRTNRFPPSIAEIREGAVEMPNLPNAAEAWAMVRKAARNGLYDSAREYAALPEPVQRALGSRNALFDMAMMDDYTIELQQSRFMRVYETETTRAKERALIPAKVMAMIETTCERLPG